MCLAITPAPLEVVNKLAEVKQPDSIKWVVNFNRLYKAWTNKTICATVTMIDGSNVSTTRK